MDQGLSPEELAELGFNSGNFSNFDASSPIWSEDPATRGRQTFGDGKEAHFTLNLVNNSVAQQTVELFNSLRSITKVPTRYGGYSVGITPQPATAGSLLKNIADSALRADLDPPVNPLPSAIGINPYAIFNDLNGDMVIMNARSLASYSTAPLDSANTNSLAYVKCQQLPYKSMLDDINGGLVFEIVNMRVQVSNILQFQQQLDYNRWGTFGGSFSDTMNYSQGRDPKNNLTDTIDLKQRYFIDKHTGIFVPLVASSSMQIDLTVRAYRNNGTIWM